MDSIESKTGVKSNELLFLYLPRYKVLFPAFTLLAATISWITEFIFGDYIRSFYTIFSPYNEEFKDAFFLIFSSGIFLLITIIWSTKPLTKISEKEQEILGDFVERSDSYRRRQEKLVKYLISQQEINTLTTAHLEDVVKETDTAAFQVIDRLQQIDQSMTELLNLLKSMSAQSENLALQTHSTISDNEQALGNLNGYIKSRLEQMERERRNVEELTRKASDMTELVELMQDITDQTNLLALNAAIEAARAGEFGRGFAVVADEVRKLSAQSEKSANQIGQAIVDMSRTVEQQFAENLKKQTFKQESDLLDALAKQLTGLEKSYRQLDELNKEMLKQVDNGSRDIANKVLDALSNIQFQDITRQQIEQVVKVLVDLNAYLDQVSGCVKKTLCCGPVCSFPDLNVDEIHSKYYVMEKQRDTHKRITSQEAKPKPGVKRIEKKEEPAESDITFF